MESLLNYLPFKIQKDGKPVTTATTDLWFLDLQLSKVNYDGLIMQLEQMFWKIVSIV